MLHKRCFSPLLAELRTRQRSLRRTTNYKLEQVIFESTVYSFCQYGHRHSAARNFVSGDADAKTFAEFSAAVFLLYSARMYI